VRQQGKGASGGFAQKAGDWNPCFLEGKKINRKPIIFLYLAVTSAVPAQRALGSDETEKIDPSIKKSFLIFPDIRVCVIKRKLYFC